MSFVEWKFNFLWSQRTEKAHISPRFLTAFVSRWLSIPAKSFPFRVSAESDEALGGRENVRYYSHFVD